MCRVSLFPSTDKGSTYFTLEQQQMAFESNFQNYWDEASKKKYGLAKIDDIFKNKNPDLSIFTFGIDLTKFGLNLNSDTEYFKKPSKILIFYFEESFRPLAHHSPKTPPARTAKISRFRHAIWSPICN